MPNFIKNVIFKKAAAVILDFQKFKILTVIIRGQHASPGQISSTSVKWLHRYGDLTFFSKWQSSTILDLLGVYWDHRRRPLHGLYRCAKVG